MCDSCSCGIDNREIIEKVSVVFIYLLFVAYCCGFGSLVMVTFNCKITVISLLIENERKALQI